MKIGRREFVQNSLLLGSAALIAPSSLLPQSVESRVEILINEPIGTINPNLYSHFVEHLGGVVYDGIWVGEKSKIPNYGGIRKALVDNLAKLKPGVIRYPGGCFADQYDWHDGVGARDKRPTRVNFWADTNYKASDAYKQLNSGPQKYEPNWFGTDEFVRFCNLVGARPYLAANVRSRDVRVFQEWLEYCNAPAGLTTLSNQRSANGSPDPYDVTFWGIGNESWGCGGDFLPEEYAEEFRKFTAWLPSYGLKLQLIGSGPNGGDTAWTRRFFSKLTEKGMGQLNKLYGWALHYYSGTTGKGNAAEFNENEWYELISRSDRMESLIKEHWQVMGETDREHRIKLIVDEWGAWHLQDPDMPPAYLYAYAGTLRDALISGLNLDTFQRNADKVAMTNPAQLINTIHSLFLAYEDKFIVTPNYHVFEMYMPHAGATAVRTEFISPQVTFTRLDAARKEVPANFWSLNGSASIKAKTVTLTAVNSDVRNTHEAEINISSARIVSANARVLSSSDIHARNTFENPHGLEPRNENVMVGPGGKLVYKFAPASVTRLQIAIA
ncbi:MAG TPA: alpha-L-arabinofuranosidase C-terminal domain-containing protein [Pyrinomonadaceae bacterium]|nr:alpha-L-arabinofuranosidase C-terminal domain-containing protein [Pyrinomonadaceae bacterium]